MLIIDGNFISVLEYSLFVSTRHTGARLGYSFLVWDLWAYGGPSMLWLDYIHFQVTFYIYIDFSNFGVIFCYALIFDLSLYSHILIYFYYNLVQLAYDAY